MRNYLYYPTILLSVVMPYLLALSQAAVLIQINGPSGQEAYGIGILLSVVAAPVVLIIGLVASFSARKSENPKLESVKGYLLASLTVSALIGSYVAWFILAAIVLYFIFKKFVN